MATFVVLHLPHSPRSTEKRGELGRRIALLSRNSYLQLDCMWLLDAEGPADEIRDRIFTGLPPDDGLIVLGLGGEAAWRNLNEERAAWLLNHV
jgi:hypothetical protein